MARTQFVNTDLDVVTRRDPAPLIAMMRSLGVPPLNDPFTREDGAWSATFECARSETPESTVTAILDAIRKLTGEAREIWYVATTRELHLGFDAGAEPRVFSEALSSETLARAAAAGMSLRITLYASRA